MPQENGRSQKQEAVRQRSDTGVKRWDTESLSAELRSQFPVSNNNKATSRVGKWPMAKVGIWPTRNLQMHTAT